MCYLFLFRNVWEHCTAQILLLHEDTCLLFRGRKYGSRVTKPYLLVYHIADLVLQLSQQRQFPIRVLELITGCWMNSSRAELLSLTQISTQEDGTPPAYLLMLCRAPVTDPDLHPGGWHAPSLFIDAMQRHFSPCMSALQTAFLPSSLTAHHLSAAKTHYKFANFTPFILL